MRGTQRGFNEAPVPKKIAKESPETAFNNSQAFRDEFASNVQADKAEILGYLAAEGNEYHYARIRWRFYPRRGTTGKWYLINYRQDAIEFTNLEPVIQRRFRKLLDDVYQVREARFGSKGTIRVRQRKIVSELLSQSRLGSFSWRVPKTILDADYRTKAAWCRGYADGDGTIGKTAIYLDSANLNGLKQVRKLLRSIEIRSRLNGPYSRRPYADIYSLGIYKDSLWKYATTVGFNHPRKKLALAHLLKNPRVDRGF